MKNPNGYGSVYKLSGKRRKPFIAQKTVGWDENGKQIYQVIGYYEKRADALKALAEFNENPYNVQVSKVTFKDVFELWKTRKYEGIGKSAINGYNAAFEACIPLHDMKFVEIKTVSMQDVILNCDKGYGTLRKIKVLFNQLFKYAMENDIVTKDYSDFVDIGKNTTENTRVPFSKAEIDKLFALEPHIEFVDTILIMIYSGLRIGELLILKCADIDIDRKIIKGGIKTEAGKDRIIPIHPRIFPFIEKRLNQNNKYLVTNNNKKMLYDNYYRDHWIHIMEQLEMNHKPHDCRHTFATLMSNADANKTAIKKIIGHSSYVTTEKIYTHKDIDELRKAVEMI